MPISQIIGSASWPKIELLIPPIWSCCGLTGGSFYIPGQIKNPAFLRASGTQAKWSAKYGPSEAAGKNEPQEGQQALSMMCDLQLCPCRKS